MGAVVVSVLTLIANLDKSRFKILINNRNKRLKRHGMIRLLKFEWDLVTRRRNRIGNVSIDVKYIELYVIYVTQDQIQSHFRVVEDADKKEKIFEFETSK